MNQNLIGLAFAAGMVAAFNPCGFAMLPAYLALVVGAEAGNRSATVRRALAATVVMALAFLTVFGVFGLLAVPVASALQRHLPYVTVGIGFLLVLLGIWLLAGRELRVPAVGRVARWAPSARMGSLYLYGVGYAIASLSCTVGPFLAVTASSVRSGSVPGVLAVYAAYAAGLTLVVGVLAVAVALASTTVVARMRRVLPYVTRLGGLLMVLVGFYVGYYGWFEIRLFGSAAGVDDPVIAGAARLQRTLAGWVYQHGPWPWLAAAVILAGVVVVAATRRRRDAAVKPATAVKPARPAAG